jgi:peptide/nickel transport system permease protein
VGYKRYVARRLLMMLFVLWGVSTLTFVIMYVLPRDPAIAMAGINATPEQIRKFDETWGFNLPLWEQYGRWFWMLLQGNLGYSVSTFRPVTTEIALHFPATLELAMSSLVVALIGIPLGVFAATKKNKAPDHGIRIFAISGVSLPAFWLGLVLLIVIYYGLGIHQLGPGRITPGLEPPTYITGLYTVDSLLTGNWRIFFDVLGHLVLPAFVLGYFSLGVISRLTRSTMLEVLSSDYIRAAQAKGVPARIIAYRHALRNALIPTITIFGVLFGAILGGTFVVETVFAYPGLGYFAWQSIIASDRPVVLGVVLVVAFIFSVMNMFVDLLYGFLDPRIRYE